MSAVWLTTFLLPPFASAQQVAPIVPTGPLPTDLTPIRLREERELFKPGPTFYLFQKLPANLWFNISAETNLRFESNVFLTAHQPKRDIVYRTFPNLTLGYNFLKNTGIYCSYFLIKDVYGGSGTFNHLTIPTNQSVSLGFRHTENWKNTYLQWDFQARELWQAKDLHQFDYIPGFFASRPLFTHPLGDGLKNKLFGNTTIFTTLQLQMRGGHAFVAPTRELDPFYTLGMFKSLPKNFVLSFTDTFITDFRDPPFRGSVPKQGNAEMISDIEIYHPLFKHHPSLVGFMRAEPIWNWRSNRAVGLSGFDFRLYTGIRLQASKTSLGSNMDQLRKQLTAPEATQGDGQQQQAQPPGSNPVPTTPVPTVPIIPGRSGMGAPPPLIIQTAYGPISIPRPDISSQTYVPSAPKASKKKSRSQQQRAEIEANEKEQSVSAPQAVPTVENAANAAEAIAIDGLTTAKEAAAFSLSLELRPPAHIDPISPVAPITPITPINPITPGIPTKPEVPTTSSAASPAVI